MGLVHLKVAPRMVKTLQLLPNWACSAGGAKLDRNFEQRGLAESSAGWRAGFQRWENILRFHYGSLFHVLGINPRAFSKLHGKLRQDGAPAPGAGQAAAGAQGTEVSPGFQAGI